MPFHRRKRRKNFGIDDPELPDFDRLMDRPREEKQLKNLERVEVDELDDLRLKL